MKSTPEGKTEQTFKLFLQADPADTGGRSTPPPPAGPTNTLFWCSIFVAFIAVQTCCIFWPAFIQQFFDLFCSFKTFFSDENEQKRLKMVEKSSLTSYWVRTAPKSWLKYTTKTWPLKTFQSVEDPIRWAFTGFLNPDSSFQSKQWQLQGVTATARWNYFYPAVKKL